jgi:hypothetical protein
MNPTYVEAGATGGKGDEPVVAATLLRRLGICIPLIAILSLAVYTASASAQATPGTFSPPPETFVGPDVSLCTGLTGINTSTFTEFFRFVDNADGTVHLELTQTLDYRTDWSDGTYLISHSVSHNELEAQEIGVDQVFTFTQQDRGTLYSPDGQVIGHQIVFSQGHFTLANGVVITTPEQHHVICS